MLSINDDHSLHVLWWYSVTLTVNQHFQWWIWVTLYNSHFLLHEFFNSHDHYLLSLSDSNGGRDWSVGACEEEKEEQAKERGINLNPSLARWTWNMYGNVIIEILKCIFFMILKCRSMKRRFHQQNSYCHNWLILELANSQNFADTCLLDEQCLFRKIHNSNENYNLLISKDNLKALWNTVWSWCCCSNG